MGFDFSRDTLQQRITPFLLRAKRATYAGKGAEGESSRPKSHDLQYSEGELLYIDSFIGEKEFAGEEAVWAEGTPVWSMNYIGRVTDPRFSGDFLKAALKAVPAERPYRGPEVYEEGDWRYECRTEGNFGWFQGYEVIYLEGEAVYDCFFHGGYIHTTR